MTPEPQVVISGQTEIPLRNVWLLLLYASAFYREGRDSFDGVEEYPECIPDLLAEILVSSLRTRLIRPLTPVFVGVRRNLPRVRGRLDLLRTESHQLLSRGQAACRFEELSVDSPRNRLVRLALNRVAPLVQSAELARECRSLDKRLSGLGVGTILKPADAYFAGTRLTRNDAQDRGLLLAARLALQLRLPANDYSPGGIRRGHLSIEDFRTLFERAIGGFYSYTAKSAGWSTRTGRFISWKAENATSGMESFLPKMQTDIVVENGVLQRRIIIDTKFTSVLQQRRFSGKAFNSGHLYQIYSYVRTQETSCDPMSTSAEGMLIYPATGMSLRESFDSSGHRFTMATVDLATAATQIRQQLLGLLDL